MQKAITEGISISVQTLFQPDFSNPLEEQFAFSYKVIIENKSEYSIQLLKRHWRIVDANGRVIEVNGEGVVGSQPVIEQNQSHEYISGCNLHTSIGNMKGYYTMIRIMDGHEFKVKIPSFNLIAPYRLN